MQKSTLYVIDLTKKFKAIRETSKANLNEKASRSAYSKKDFFNYEVKVFDSFDDAIEFLAKFKDVERRLPKLTNATTKAKASMLLKRRYLVLTALGLKTQTTRSSERVNELMAKVKLGETFRFYDQTCYLDVTLTKRVSRDFGDVVTYHFTPVLNEATFETCLSNQTQSSKNTSQANEYST